MGNLIQGATFNALISLTTEEKVDLVNMKLFVTIKPTKTVLQKFSINSETGFTVFTVDGNDYQFTLSSEATALRGSGNLSGEIMLFYPTKVVKQQFDFSATIIESISKNETA